MFWLKKHIKTPYKKLTLNNSKKRRLIFINIGNKQIQDLHYDEVSKSWIFNEQLES